MPRCPAFRFDDRRRHPFGARPLHRSASAGVPGTIGPIKMPQSGRILTVNQSLRSTIMANNTETQTVVEPRDGVLPHLRSRERDSQPEFSRLTRKKLTNSMVKAITCANT